MHKLGHLPRVELSFSVLLLFQADPLGCRGSLRVHFSAWASRTHAEGAKGGTLRYSNGRRWPIAELCDHLAWDFIGFLCKSRLISLSSLLYSLNYKFFHTLSLYIYVLTPFKLWIPWMQLGKDPSKGPFPCLVGKESRRSVHLKGRRSHVET